jgi:hypothetical protein
MKMRHTLLLQFFLVSLAFSQTIVNRELSSRERMLLENRKKVQTKVTLNATEYWAGETYAAEFSVTNPTQNPLEIPDPSPEQGYGFDLLRFNDQKPKPGEPPAEFEVLAAHPYSDRMPTVVDGPSVVLQPGQSLRIQIDSRIHSYRSDDGGVSGIPDRTGKYRLVYSYWPRASADFHVVAPTLEQFEELQLLIPLEGREGGTPNGRPFIAQRYVYGYVLSVDNVRYLAITPSWSTSPLREIPDRTRPANDIMISNLSPYIRLQRVDNLEGPIRLSANLNDEVSIIWPERGGREQLLRVNQCYKPERRQCPNSGN